MANFFKIYSGDYSKDGYNGGIEDGKSKRVTNRFRFFKAIHPINYIWNFNNSYDSFMQNYKEGYLDGQKVVNEVYTTNRPKGDLMEKDSYEYHLKLIEDFESKLDKLKPYLDDISKQYQRQINAMAGAGFFSNHIIPLQNRYLTFQSKIDSLQSLIDRHKQQLSLHQEKLNNLINSPRR